MTFSTIIESRTRTQSNKIPNQEAHFPPVDPWLGLHRLLRVPVRRLAVNLSIRVRAGRSTSGAQRALRVVPCVCSHADSSLRRARSVFPHAFHRLRVSMSGLLGGPRSGLTLRRALVPLWLLPLWLGLWLVLLLSVWIATK